MIDIIMGLFGGQVGAIIAGVIGIAAVFFGLKSKVKTATIAKQKKIITSQEIDKVVLTSAINTQKETMKQERKTNEILSERVDVSDAVKRLRKRRTERDNCGEG